MARKKKVSPKKTRSTQSKRKFKEEQKARRKSRRKVVISRDCRVVSLFAMTKGNLKKVLKRVKIKKTRNLNTFLAIALFFLLLANLFLVLPRGENNNSSGISASSIRHLIASISAQNQPIKIDPEFSYQEEELEKEAPVRIVVPSVKIDASVVEAPIIDGFWKTATDSASFGLGSAYPSQVGNTVIFAHAIDDLFANLRLIQPGASIYLFTESQWLAYKVKEIKTVLPSQVEVISPTEDRTLTLYTCDGYRDAYRLVVVAKP